MVGRGPSPGLGVVPVQFWDGALVGCWLRRLCREVLLISYGRMEMVRGAFSGPTLCCVVYFWRLLPSERFAGGIKKHGSGKQGECGVVVEIEDHSKKGSLTKWTIKTHHTPAQPSTPSVYHPPHQPTPHPSPLPAPSHSPAQRRRPTATSRPSHSQHPMPQPPSPHTSPAPASVTRVAPPKAEGRSGVRRVE